MLIENGCWQDYRVNPQSIKPGLPAIFLDRDGVVVEEIEYLHTAEQTKLIPGAAELVLAANKAGWLCGLVTNQSGIARGFYDWPDFQIVQKEIDNQLAKVGAKLDFILACPYYKDAKVKRYQATNHPWRKPNPGMILDVLNNCDVGLNKTLLIGDKISDLEAGEKAGISTLIHVLTGHGRAERNDLVQSHHWKNKVLVYPSIGAPEILALIKNHQTL